MKVNSLNYLISGIVFFITFLVYFATIWPLQFPIGIVENLLLPHIF